MAATKEDCFRSVHDALLIAPSMAGVSVQVEQFVQSNLGLNEWIEFQLGGFSPTNGRATQQVEFGTFRVLCRWREEPTGGGAASITRIYALVDKVTAALRWKDVTVKDFASGSGTATVGIVACREIGVEDQGDPVDGVRTVVCSVEFLFSGAA